MLIKIMFSDWKADHKYQPREKKTQNKRTKQTSALSKGIKGYLHIFPVIINLKWR